MVGDRYLEKVRRAVRRTSNIHVDLELIDLIEECRQDLIKLGVLPEYVNDETDRLILGAVRCFVRWKFGLSNEDAEQNRRDYMIMRDELRKKVEYCTSRIL